MGSVYKTVSAYMSYYKSKSKRSKNELYLSVMIGIFLTWKRDFKICHPCDSDLITWIQNLTIKVEKKRPLRNKNERRANNKLLVEIKEINFFCL